MTERRDAIEPFEAMARMSDGARVGLKPGHFRLKRSIEIEVSDVAVEGWGTVFHVPSGAGFSAIVLKNCRHVWLSGITVVEDDDRYKAVRGTGVSLLDGCEDVTLANIHTRGMRRGISVVGRSLETGPRRVVIRDCHVQRAVGWGVEASYASGVLIDNLWTHDNGLEGIKTVKEAPYLTVRDSISEHNDPLRQSNGNGIDLYAGGRRVVINGLRCLHNHGAGLNIKSGPLVREGDMVGEILVSNVHCEGNTAAGLDMNAQTEQGEPAVQRVVVQGAMLLRNKTQGLRIGDAVDVVLGGIMSGENGQRDYVSQNSRVLQGDGK